MAPYSSYNTKTSSFNTKPEKYRSHGLSLWSNALLKLGGDSSKFLFSHRHCSILGIKVIIEWTGWIRI